MSHQSKSISSCLWTLIYLLDTPDIHRNLLYITFCIYLFSSLVIYKYCLYLNLELFNQSRAVYLFLESKLPVRIYNSNPAYLSILQQVGNPFQEVIVKPQKHLVLRAGLAASSPSRFNNLIHPKLYYLLRGVTLNLILNLSKAILVNLFHFIFRL